MNEQPEMQIYRAGSLRSDASVYTIHDVDKLQKRIATLEADLKKTREWNDKISADLDKGDSWAWIRQKFERCRTQFAWYKPRTDSLVGTRYEIMGWLHVLFAHADPQIYIDITMEQQKKADDAIAERDAEILRSNNWATQSGIFERERAAALSQLADLRIAKEVDEKLMVTGGQVVAELRAEIEQLRRAVVIACRSGKFGNPEAAAAKIITSLDKMAKLQIGQRVRVDHPRFHGEGVLARIEPARPAIAWVTLEHGEDRWYESNTVTPLEQAGKVEVQ